MNWINSRSGKSWSDEEEADFAEIMRVGKLERLPAIRLFKQYQAGREESCGTCERGRRSQSCDVDAIKRWLQAQKCPQAFFCCS